MTKDSRALLQDSDGRRAQARRELREYKNLQDPGSEPMSAGERLDLLEHRNAPRIREKYSIPGNEAQSMHDAPQSAMRDLPNWEAGTSFTVLGESELHRSIDAGWKREFQAMGKSGPSHITAKQLEDVVGRSIDQSALSPEQKVALKQRVKDELYLDYGLTEDSLVRRPYSGRGPAAPATPTSATTSGFHKVDIHSGIRLHDQQVLADAAQEYDRWIGIQYANPESMQYIGKPGFVPKPIDCTALTSDMPGHPQAGLVADPNIHSGAFRDPATAQQRWNKMHEHLPDGYEVDLDKSSPGYGCLQHRGKYLHGDYELYDVIDTHNPDTHNPREIRGRSAAVVHSINERIGTPMIQQGGEYQLQDHTNRSVMFFGPKGERLQVRGEAALQELYMKKFEGRVRPADQRTHEEPRVAGTDDGLKPHQFPPYPQSRFPDSHQTGGPPPRVTQPVDSKHHPGSYGPPGQPPPGGGIGPGK